MLVRCSLILFLANVLYAQQNVESKYESWLMPPPTMQLYEEAFDDQKGMGRIFVPAMTSPNNEPKYAVFRDDVLIGEQSMGTSMFLEPGKYKVLLGTGTLQQLISKEVEIQREQTVILEPDWCALSVEMIDETRNYITQGEDNVTTDLEIYQATTLESYGIITAINPELGEQLQSLLLPPGVYKIIERGLGPNTIVNFTTITLQAGTYTPFTIVIHSQTGHFVGSGILSSKTQLKQRRQLKLFGAIHGSVRINTANDVSTREVKRNLTIETQIENRILYDKLPHYYLSYNLLELGALRQQGEAFLVSQDKLQLKNTYVYYLLNWLGGYARFEIGTHIFPTYELLNTDRNVAFRDLNGIEENRIHSDKINFQKAIYPLSLKEGFGVNVTPVRTFQARISFRTGFGFRQIYNNNVFQKTEESDTLTAYTRIPNSFLRGVETSVVTNVTLLRNLANTMELDVLFPIASDERNPVLDFENVASLGLTRNMSVEYIFRLERIPSIDWTLQEQVMRVRVSYFFF